MRKLILGIIALVCLDIGFVAYTSVDLQADLVVKKSEVPNLANLPIVPTELPVPPAAENVADSPDLADANVKSENISNNREIVRISMEPRMPNAKARLRKREHALTARNQPLFTPIVFYAPGTSAGGTNYIVAVKDVPSFKPAAEKQPVTHRPKPENRSLVARAWPVIKKPYEWIKVLGSKFN